MKYILMVVQVTVFNQETHLKMSLENIIICEIVNSIKISVSVLDWQRDQKRKREKRL